VVAAQVLQEGVLLERGEREEEGVRVSDACKPVRFVILYADEVKAAARALRQLGDYKGDTEGEYRLVVDALNACWCAMSSPELLEPEAVVMLTERSLFPIEHRQHEPPMFAVRPKPTEERAP